MKAVTAQIQSTFDFAMREINALESQIVTAEDDADAMLWEQARQVVEQLKTGRVSQEKLAAEWINTRTGKPYSQKHVSRVLDTFQTFKSENPRPRFRKAFNEIANKPPEKSETPEPVDDRSPMDVHHSSESVEHYTPAEIIEAAIACLGAIDLDPCSNEGDPNVPAARRFTLADDGLTQSWAGRVYMNPPYGREIAAWIEKLCAEHARPDGVTEAIALVPARPDTAWCRLLRDYVRCEVAGRLTFIGNDDPAPFPSFIFYLGNDEGKFYRTFAAFGDIWQRIEPPMFAE
jgi:DNA N-6-adenine-methyltransferase (Dam)